MSNKNKIADVAFALSMENGFDNVTMKQIQEASGLSIGTIYYYFDNKSEILIYMLKTYLRNAFNGSQEVMTNINGSFFEKIEFIFKYKLHDFIKIEADSFLTNKNQEDYKEYYKLITTIYHQNPQVRDLFNEINDELLIFVMNLLKRE